MDTRRTSLQDVTVKTSDSNAALWLDKFIAGQNRKDEKTENSADKFKQQVINETAIIETPNIYAKFFDRWRESLDAVGAKFKKLKIDGRMAVGLGAESVLETSVMLHRTYGVPFIPGSALKGLAASYAHKNLGDDWRKETGKAHEFIFGSQSSAGFAVFHDALLMPRIKNALHADIMTIHHAAYYGGENVAPADWDSPAPIPFLSATGEYFAAVSFAAEAPGKWIEYVWLILERALQEEGVGAKTSSGYGRAQLAELTDSDRTAKMREAAANRRKAESERLKREAEEAKEKEKRETERRHTEFQAQREAERQAADEQRRTAVDTRIGKNLDQIKAIDDATKKPEKIFEEIAGLIYKIENTGQKRDLSKTVLAEIKRLENENLKIDTSGNGSAHLKK